MKNTLLLTASLFFLLFCAGSLHAQFVQNNGQIADGEGNLHPEILFKSGFDDATLFFKQDGIVYLFQRFDVIPNKASEEAKAHGDLVQSRLLETRPMMFRMDLTFLNTNPAVKIITGEARQETSNYYLPHCPEGIIAVNSFDKIIYKELYPNIDVEYYYTDQGLKYDIIVRSGGKISDIQFTYQGSNNIILQNDGRLLIQYADGQQMFEDAPIAFYENDQENKQPITFALSADGTTIGFSGTMEDAERTLIIDPSVTWASYFHNTNSANSSWTNPEYDASGNLFLAVQTYDAAFPLANPGGGAYYDATKTVMMEVAVLKFNTSRTLIWSTYYGGNQYNQLAGCTDYGKALAVDNSGNVYVAGSTTGGTTVFPTLNPGGGAFYQDQSRCYGETSFFVKFNNNGVRQWATMFTHETASTSGTMMRVNGITCDGTNLFFTGQQYNWTPANTIPLRNPGGGAHYQSTILGDQDVFVGKFNSVQSLVWCTYVHSTVGTNTAYGQGLDVHCDASGNFYMIGRESGANSHHYLINPGGGAYYQAVKGGSDDLIITKFNASLTATWSTYYGGNGMDICSTIEPDYLGNMYILGRNTPSTNFPTQNPGGGALCQITKSNAACDGFLIKFNAAGVRSWATYLGANVPTAGSDENHFSAIAFNSTNNNVFVTGYTPSVLMATTSKAGAYNQAANAGNYDLFMYEFNSGGVVQWASYYGTAGSEYFYNGRMGGLNTACGVKLHYMLVSTSNAVSTVNPGGGAWYQNTTTFANNDIILEMSDMAAASPVSVSITASSNPVCFGNSVTFTASPTNGGTPTYQWYLNGSAVGSNSSTYSNGSLANGDQVYVVMTSSLSCVSGNPATSNTVTMTISLPSTTGLGAGDYVWWPRISNNWATNTNWLYYNGSAFSIPADAPASTNNVFILTNVGCVTQWPLIQAAGAVCKSITIGVGAQLSINTTYTLGVYGDWTNNGTFSCGQSIVSFLSATNATITGATTFYDLTMNKGTGTTVLLNINSAVTVSHNSVTALTFTNGLMTVNATGSLTLAAGPTISATAGLHFNGGTLVAGNYTLTNNGLFRITSGTVNLGTIAGNSYDTQNGSTTNISGGAFNIAGRFNATGNASVAISGGTINLCTVGNIAATANFSIASTSALNITAGILYINNAATGTGYDINIITGAGAKTIGGGTMQIGVAATPNTAAFRIFNNAAPFYNLNIFRCGTATLYSPITIATQLAFTTGYLVTDATNFLNFADNSNYTGASDNSFADGPVKKTGDDLFLFPTGDRQGTNKFLGQIRMADPGITATDAFTAEYHFISAPNNWFLSDMCTGIDHASGVEYWDIARNSGSTYPALTLYWTNGTRSGINNLTDLTVVHWEICPATGTNKWVDKGGTTTGTTAAGTITSTIGFPSYSPVTFGAKKGTTNPLPVTIVDFGSDCNSDGIHLFWTTASETNSDYFEIQRSSDGADWTPLTVLDAAGNSNAVLHYYYTDYTAGSGTYYYRLFEVDMDGATTSFGPISNQCDGSGNIQILLYPNPFDRFITITFTEDNAFSKAMVYDVLGKLVYSAALIKGEDGQAQIDLSALSRGMYFLQLSGSDQYFRTRIIKE